MNKMYILMGSNLGESGEHLQNAGKAINKKIGRTIRQSGVYRTAAWGKTDQPDFLNQVIVVETMFSALEVMKSLLVIEKDFGRIRSRRNEPRIIDLDILYYNKDIINEPGLTIPHPRITERRFVLVPLNELSPLFKDPITHKTIHQLLRICSDKLAVKKI